MLHRTSILTDPDATTDFAQTLGTCLRPKDVLLLHGPVGAGKSHFARGLIQSLQTPPEDVPSPTFTLVQTYETSKGPIWHCDLYRMSGADELIELGLLDAFDDAITIIEWPDRLGELTPVGALHLTFQPDPTDTEKRELRISSENEGWATRLKRVLA